jgi:hypothetical protein
MFHVKQFVLILMSTFVAYISQQIPTAFGLGMTMSPTRLRRWG